MGDESTASDVDSDALVPILGGIATVRDIVQSWRTPEAKQTSYEQIEYRTP